MYVNIYAKTSWFEKEAKVSKYEVQAVCAFVSLLCVFAGKLNKNNDYMFTTF